MVTSRKEELLIIASRPVSRVRELPVLSAYSVLKFFTGFAMAALIAWKLTVAMVMNRAPIAARMKTHSDISVR